MRKSLSEAVKHLFGIKISDYPELRNALNKMESATIIIRDPNKEPYDKHKYFTEKAFPAIHNTIILHALLLQTKKIKDVFTQQKTRESHAESARQLLSLPFFKKIGLTDDTEDFLAMLKSDRSLIAEKLPNPFTRLPQTAFGSKHSTLVDFVLKISNSSPECEMLQAYLDKDINNAYEIARCNSFKTKEAKNLQRLIKSQYEAATRAQDFINTIL